ncbi:MAG TPA: hypothetical protein VFT66_18650 [Roseiflexaceae bacterium]|nr:hypothetical protein [Roseiflexaceae bacterium]
MQLIRKTLALLAWIAIYIPTTLFVIGVMIKAYLEQRQQRRNARETQLERI